MLKHRFPLSGCLLLLLLSSPQVPAGIARECAISTSQAILDRDQAEFCISLALCSHLLRPLSLGGHTLYLSQVFSRKDLWLSRH